MIYFEYEKYESMCIEEAFQLAVLRIWEASNKATLHVQKTLAGQINSGIRHKHSHCINHIRKPGSARWACQSRRATAYCIHCIKRTHSDNLFLPFRSTALAHDFWDNICVEHSAYGGACHSLEMWLIRLELTRLFPGYTL